MESQTFMPMHFVATRALTQSTPSAIDVPTPHPMQQPQGKHEPGLTLVWNMEPRSVMVGWSDLVPFRPPAPRLNGSTQAL